jgi:hypothetical protein
MYTVLYQENRKYEKASLYCTTFTTSIFGNGLDLQEIKAYVDFLTNLVVLHLYPLIGTFVEN